MKKMFVLAIGALLFIGCNNNDKDADKKTDSAPAVAAADTKMQDAEFADAKYMEMGKKALAAMSSGDIDGWVSNYADNAVYYWNGGDSVSGKAAITAYWKKRRTEVIDSISFSSDIWLPLKVNKPQAPEQAPGVWLLGWYRINAKYKSGKSMVQWSHIDYHFDANDKIDRVIQYIDKAPINAAAAK
jgi:hypothetical protein